MVLYLEHGKAEVIIVDVQIGLMKSTFNWVVKHIDSLKPDIRKIIKKLKEDELYVTGATHQCAIYEGEISKRNEYKKYLTFLG